MISLKDNFDKTEGYTGKGKYSDFEMYADEESVQVYHWGRIKANCSCIDEALFFIEDEEKYNS